MFLLNLCNIEALSILQFFEPHNIKPLFSFQKVSLSIETERERWRSLCSSSSPSSVSHSVLLHIIFRKREKPNSSDRSLGITQLLILGHWSGSCLNLAMATVGSSWGGRDGINPRSLTLQHLMLSSSKWVEHESSRFSTMNLNMSCAGFDS